MAEITVTEAFTALCLHVLSSRLSSSASRIPCRTVGRQSTNSVALP